MNVHRKYRWTNKTKDGIIQNRVEYNQRNEDLWMFICYTHINVICLSDRAEYRIEEN